MAEFSKYIGMDVHKETIAVAVAEGEGGAGRTSEHGGAPGADVGSGGRLEPGSGGGSVDGKED